VTVFPTITHQQHEHIHHNYIKAAA